MSEWTVIDTCGNGRFTVLRRGPSSDFPDVDMGNEVDAALAAAAPQLYEVLRDMVAIARHENWQYQTDTGRNILLEQAEAALDAAKVGE